MSFKIMRFQIERGSLLWHFRDRVLSINGAIVALMSLSSPFLFTGYPKWKVLILLALWSWVILLYLTLPARRASRFGRGFLGHPENLPASTRLH